MRVLLRGKKALVVAAIAVLALWGCAATLPFEQTLREQAAPTVRILKGDSGNCSAVVVAPGYAFTARHCKDIVSSKVDGHPIAEWREFSSKDLAIVKVPGLLCPCAVASSPPLAGERVSAIGFPYGIGLTLTYGEAQGDVFYENERYAHHTAFTMPGMSGGGIFTLRGGRVILVAITSRSAGSSTLSVAVDGLYPRVR